MGKAVATCVATVVGAASGGWAVSSPDRRTTRVQPPRDAALEASVTPGSVSTAPEAHTRRRTRPASMMVRASAEAWMAPSEVNRANRAGPSLRARSSGTHQMGQRGAFE